MSMKRTLVPLGDGGTFIIVFVPLLPDNAEELLTAYRGEVARRGPPFVIPDGDLVDPDMIPVVLLAVPDGKEAVVMARFKPPLTELPTEQIVTNIGRSNRRCGVALRPDNVSVAFDIALDFKKAETERRP
jgi:hypothetical protein